MVLLAFFVITYKNKVAVQNLTQNNTLFSTRHSGNCMKKEMDPLGEKFGKGKVFHVGCSGFIILGNCES